MQNKKTVLITGATNGLGKESAILFKKENWNVIVSGRNPEKLKKFEELGFQTIKLDVTDNNDIGNLKTYLSNNNINVDVLLNNAGYGQFSTFEETEIDAIYKQFETNFFGLIKITKIILPFMRKQRHGKIINISSIAGVMSFPVGGYYAATKYAIEAISDALRYEVRKYNIKVVLIEPGPLSTDFFNVVNYNIFTKNDEYQHIEKVYKYLSNINNIPLLKLGSPLGMARKIVVAANRKHPKNRYIYPAIWRVIKFFYKCLPSKLIDALINKIIV